MAVAKNIILAAIPRSGSTLACQLLNQSPDCVALIEPLNMPEFTALANATARLSYLGEFFSDLRQEILQRGEIPVMQLHNQSTNTFSDKGKNGRSSAILGTEWQASGHKLSENFTLIIKHPNAFSALLGELSANFPCYALMRNPLAILASWNSLNHPLREGHAPMAEHFDKELKTMLGSHDDMLTRQLSLLSWYYQNFSATLPPEHIIKYEDVIRSNGTNLAIIAGTESTTQLDLNNQNANAIYDSEFISKAAKALLQDADNYCWHFYQQTEVETLASSYAG